ncbi:MAG: hypothetical protein WAK72_16275, partial [Pseudolabrys sp.]
VGSGGYLRISNRSGWATAQYLFLRFKLEPVFEAMLENATRICEASFGNLFLREGDAYRAVAVHGEPDYVAYWRHQPAIPMPDNEGMPLERLTKRCIARLTD